MSTPIPTSDPISALAAQAVNAHGAPPPGVPDESLLSRLAREFFQALPGAAPGLAGLTNFRPAGAGLPTADPLSIDAAAPAAGARDARHPAASAPVQVPASDLAAVPVGSTSSASLQPLGVPASYASAIPQVPLAAPQELSPPVSPPTSPYYYIGEAQAQSASAHAPVAAPAQGGDDRVTALSHSLPGQDSLRALLLAPSAPQGLGAQQAPASAAPSSPGFYFLDPLQAGSLAQAGAHPPFDVNAVRRDFPILQERVNGRPLIWFDNAATTHKPQAVIDRLSYFYAHENSNIHRAAHELAARATDAYEAARQKTARFLGAASPDEIVFVRGATEAINLVAKSWGQHNIGPGDEIIVSHLEHHANIVPWQQLAADKGAKLRVIPVDDSGQILLNEYGKLLNDRTKLVAVTQVSNALGTITPIQEIVEMAHRAGAKALVDGAQSVSHMRVNVQAIDADFFVFSGHKVFAPTGIGVLYGKSAILQDMPPWQGGGNMIADVTFERTVYQPAPARFEAGVGNIADAVGLGAAIDYVERVGMENIARYEHDLLIYATHGLSSIPGLRLIGTAQNKASVLSFVLDGYQSEEVGKALNTEGIAVRSGHHCAQPILRRFGLETTVRPSLAFYNSCDEVDVLVDVVRRLANKR